ncbi:2,3-diphosphoglycerate-dependent phosphoglycerate mutase [Clostridium neonatale]|uniref:2,3-bisphosphoglycerate-dependent phosphoglycerate mutase n=1 Tax=Clostridium neonatale TaxID=137838 RepID=A0A650LRC1_9CLOT|nr:2,3-diphosphoglycerate-dependent phosphoglycerate mutase [Clostridium neonatale]MBP8314371.1 2,3-diphosphoglycerate-dependent phosphoglycerate mutase [Clostridium neonatale]CAG9709961.1 2,3-bisphosphoglycerate-dependent phosphoglycerate mutase [Clostridium neonatale]CAI3581766.1 2,3-bisphosphoglycerate-dependent phosphoglycerate mutase [Clostridium neonatale]CAI3585947.1 2,3-bisphosphoglycerate-dependent phosphoglycerate mutase [Clostridium neonatale]CAI3586569.1 2,3-bisphosphoglycerate-dep
MKKIVFIRHGQSEWNLENIFTGWTDVELSENGLIEARKAGRILKENNFSFDVAYSSVLKRSIRTLWIVLHEMDLMYIPVHKCWKFNERHYGALQGLNKEETAKKYGDEQVHIWRRSINTSPPALTEDDPRYAGKEEKYKELKKEKIPLTENLEDTKRRVLEEWEEVIVPKLKENKNIIISAHGNTLRALVWHLDNLDSDGVVNLNIPTGTPLVYELDDDLNPIRHYYLSLDGVMPDYTVPKYIL